MPDWLLFSIIASVVLTVALNLILRLFPSTARRTEDRLFQEMRKAEKAPGPGFRIYFPWKFMLIASVGLTVLLNLVAWLLRMFQSG